ncbi:MAG: hypothetical protein ABW137_05040 [Mycobacterium sp.]
MTTRGWHTMLCKAVAAAGFVGAAALGAAVPANAAPVGTGSFATTNDPGCDMFGWRHPMCAGGAWGDDESASQEWGPANIPNPVTPNGDTSMTFPGSPNTP